MGGRSKGGCISPPHLAILDLFYDAETCMNKIFDIGMATA